MNFIEKQENDILTVELKGSLDQECGQIREMLEPFLDRDINVLKFDMGKVTYISSSGLAALISTRKKALKLAKNVLIINPSKQVKEVLDVVRMSRIFGLESNMY